MAVEFIKRYRWWLVLAILAAAILIYWLGVRMIDRDPIADPELLIEKFRITVFYNDVGPDKDKPKETISKWTAPIQIGLDERADHFHKEVESLSSELSRLTGVPMEIIEPGNQISPNLFVFFIEPDKVEAFLESLGEPSIAIKERIASVCMANIKRDFGRYFLGVAVIKNNLSEDLNKRCLIEEITHSMGLIGDSELFQPSIFSNFGPTWTTLPLNDKILLRTLYDKRIKPGMAREEAMKIAAEIIPELVAAVKAKGVEALYQQ